MRKTIHFLIITFCIAITMMACKKMDESSARLAKFAKELNESPDKDLSNGTILTGCEYIQGDTLFTYIIKVTDNRYDKLSEDSIKRNFAKTVKSKEMKKIVTLLDKANVGLKYRLNLPDKEVGVEFSHSEIANISRSNAK